MFQDQKQNNLLTLLLVNLDSLFVMTSDILNYSVNYLSKELLHLLTLLLSSKLLEKHIGMLYKNQEPLKTHVLSLHLIQQDLLSKIEIYMVIVQSLIHGEKYYQIWNNMLEFNSVKLTQMKSKKLGKDFHHYRIVEKNYINDISKFKIHKLYIFIIHLKRLY